ncbi:glycosyl hydrolase family 18 protein [Chitinibacter bivalviorum]|nr:glycosyl hydrolase family 18 protein [Chitinibacter bivalviorum]
MKYLAKTVLASSLVMIGSHAMAADCATPWSAGTTYSSAGTTVSQGGHNYTNKWWTLNEDPSKSGAYGVWTDAGVCGAGTATPAPTAVVTAAPTATPVVTVAPTTAPTAAPTAKPTATPVVTTPPAGTCAVWAEGSSYKAGDVVSYNGVSYTALSAHTAYVGAGWTPATTPTLWKVGGTCGTVTPTATPAVTVAPTATPVVTAAPTATPVVTAKPTATPVVTIAPTATPVVTVAPTATPAVTTAPTANPVVTVAPTATPVTTPSSTPAPVGSREVGSYFTQWGVYDSAFFAKAVDTSGAADKLTYINYAFGNIYKQADGTIKCDSGINKANDNNPNGDGGDAWADYQMDYKAADSVDGVGDTWESTLKGNFNQLKKLKAKHPNLKVMISLGGWTWSRYFSTAASTDANRKALVASCIDVYLKGNLKKSGGDPAGGTGVAKGIFDGIDIDWEYPGVQGIGTNVVDPVNDKHNLTLLMAEFRKQLDAYSATQGGKKFYLTAAIGAGSEKIDQTEPAEYSKSMDWVNVMTYDFHGDWDTTVNFHSHLYPDPADPQRGTIAGSYNIDQAISKLINLGFPAEKLVLGIPNYGRGFGGVNTSVNNGLYQPKTKSAALVGVQTEAGYADYKALVNLAGPRFYHPVTKQLYMYTATGDWWSYDDVQTIRLKNDYIKAKGLRGNFSWALDGDDANATLTKTMAEVK